MPKNKRYRIYNKDVIKWAEKYSGEKFHALLCDAPYHLTTITKRFGKMTNETDGVVADRIRNRSDGYARLAASGFMGVEWDGGDISFRPETWAALGEHLLPGAFGMTFGGSRTAHRIAVAIEDAGFIIHPSIYWVYGCLSEDSEVLTDRGFKRYHKITKYDRILAYDNQTNLYQWEVPQRWQAYRVYKDTAYRIESDNTSQVVSRNHRCLVEREGKLVFVQAEMLSGVEYMPTLSNDFLSIQERCKALLLKGVQWASSRTRMEVLCSFGKKKLEQEIRKRTSKKNDRGEQPILERWTYLSKTKRFVCQSINKVCEMSQKVFGYGSQRWLCYGTSFISSTSNWQATDQTRSSSSHQPQRRGQSFGESDVVQNQQGTQTVRTRSKYKTTLATVTPIEYSGLIFCPTISTGAFVARRDGKIFITGNSGFPKATRVKGHKNFDGHRYGLQALKPAAEPIIVFQKPYDGKPIDNIVRTGAGALNIDAGRIALADGDEYTINTFDDGAKPFGNGAGHKYTTRKIKEDKRLGGKGSWKTDKAAKNVYEGGYAGVDIESSPLGRWPANFVMDDAVAPALNAQSGISKSVGGKGKATQEWSKGTSYGWKHGETWSNAGGIGDEGGASRFFFNVNTQLEESDPFLYVKKAGGKERNAGLDNEPVVLRRTHGEMSADKSGNNHNTTGQKPASTRNDHPTVKPIDLNRYLASLLLPPDGYAPRRLLVPFSGVSSEMIGGLLAGWEYVEGIERGKHYCELGEKRIKYWLK